MYVFIIMDSEGKIKGCWEAPTLPEGSDNPLQGNRLPDGKSVVRINLDMLQADMIRQVAASKGITPSKLIMDEYMVDMTTEVPVPEGLIVSVPVRNMVKK